MKWQRAFSTVCLLLLLLVGSPSLVTAESTPPTYSELLTELTKIWKELNQLSVNSEISLTAIQAQWPSLLKEVQDFGIKLKAYEKKQATMSASLKSFNQDFSLSQTKLIALKNQYDGVLLLAKTLQTSFTNIEDEVRSMRQKTNTGLWISIGAALIGAIAIGISIFGGNK